MEKTLMHDKLMVQQQHSSASRDLDWHEQVVNVQQQSKVTRARTNDLLLGGQLPQRC